MSVLNSASTSVTSDLVLDSINKNNYSNDPLLIHPNTTSYGSVLIIGKTNSGKSTLVAKAAKTILDTKKKKNLVLINFKDKDLFSNYKPQYLNLLEIDKAPHNSIIIIEDIIVINKKEENKLRLALNYSAHHKNQLIYCITHHVFKTSLYSMLPFFNFIVFTSSHSNLPLLKSILGYFRLEENDLKSALQLFLQSSTTYYFFYYLDTHFLTFHQTSMASQYGINKQTSFKAEKKKGKNSSVTPALKNILMEKFESFFESHPLRIQALKIFALILPCLQLATIRESDLTMSFIKKGTIQRVSLVDYVLCLLTPDETVNKDLKFLHLYIQKYCTIPKIFVKNKNFT